MLNKIDLVFHRRIENTGNKTQNGDGSKEIIEENELSLKRKSSILNWIDLNQGRNPTRSNKILFEENVKNEENESDSKNPVWRN